MLQARLRKIHLTIQPTLQRTVTATLLAVAVALTANTSMAQQSAQRDSQAQREVEEIVVSARRRDESVQDVPMAITALSDVTLQRQNIVRMEDIADIVPNLIMTESERVNNSRITIRGIGGGNPTQLFSSGVGLYVDGMYLANSIGPYTSTFEVERIEVLKGPQGTLYGKNTTGGLINVVTKRPGPEPEASVTLGYGRFNDVDLRFSMNQPLVEDKLFARVGIGYQSDDGYMTELNTGDGYGNRENRSFRLALRWLPSDQWTFDIIGTHIYEPRKQTGGKCVYVSDTPNNTDRNESGGGDLFGGAFEEACNLTANAGKWEFYSDVQGYSKVTIHSLVGSAEWSSGRPMLGFDDLTIKATAGYRSTAQEYRIDNEWSNSDLIVRQTEPNGGGTVAHGETFELLFDGSAMDGRLDAVFGYYYFRDRVTVDGMDCFDVYETVRGTGETAECYQPGYTSFRNIPHNLTGEGPDPYGKSYTPHKRPSQALFAHTKWNLTDRLTFDLGARYTYEKLWMRNLDWTSTRTPAGFKHYLNDDTVELRIEASESWSAFTPAASLTYALGGMGAMDDGIVYGSVATGFQSGGINNELPVEDFGDLAVFDPEHVTTYEIGLKSTWAENRIRANLALFYTDYKDKQETITVDNSDGRFPAGGGVTVFDNAAKLTIKGVELETTLNLLDALTVDLNVAYLNNRYDDFPTFDLITGEIVDQSDVVVNDFSPELTGNAAVSYMFELPGGSTLTPRMGVYFQEPYRTNEHTNVHQQPGGVCYRPGYGKLDGRLSWRSMDGDRELALWGTNLGSKEIFRTCGVNNGYGFQSYVLEPPLRYGIQFTQHW